jgi:choline dehydrogenase-like flavoprotein
MPLASASILENEFDVCIVGAGPAGLACGLHCRSQGLRVVILDAGGLQPKPGEPDLLAADILDPRFHAPVDIVAAAALGGSSHWWGGRCMPLDPVDFRTWPIDYNELRPWWRKAAEFLGSSDAFESEAPEPFDKLDGFTANRCETSGAIYNMQRRWRDRLFAADGPAIVLGARVTELLESDGRASVRVRAGTAEYQVRARNIVLASGGLGSVRLMLMAQRTKPRLFGGASGPLGRGYMGHLTGSIADMTGIDLQAAAALALQPHGSGLRHRRLQPTNETVEQNILPNIAFWVTNSDLHDAGHGSAVASARYLAARIVRRMVGGKPTGQTVLKSHLANVARQPVAALGGLVSAASLLLQSRLHGHHVRRTGNPVPSRSGWRLAYHAEQARHESNRISLSDTTDSLGLPKLKIDFKFTDEDLQGVVRAHDVLDKSLRDAGVGALRWRMPPEDRLGAVREAALDGYHQMGGAMMSPQAETGVVDTQLRVHGFSNLWVASSSVFPSGGQANPTLTIVALSLRLADQLCQRSSVSVAPLPSVEKHHASTLAAQAMSVDRSAC